MATFTSTLQQTQIFLLRLIGETNGNHGWTAVLNGVLQPKADVAVVNSVVFYLLVSAALLPVVGFVDLIVARRFVKPYFALHVIVNAAIVATGASDALDALLYPAQANTCGASCASMLPACLSLAIHVYHPLAFKLVALDWQHHLPVYFSTLLAFCFSWGSNLNLTLTVLTGVPGGLDYLLLVAQHEGWMDRFTYKKWSATINVFFRAPFACVTGFIGLTSIHSQWAQHTSLQVVCALVINFHSLWNGPFFMRQTVEALVIETINVHQLRGSTEKGKQLRLDAVQKLYRKPKSA